MTDGLRLIIGVMCLGFAVIVGGLALALTVRELVEGQAHGPSVTFMSALISPFVLGAAWVAWRVTFAKATKKR